MKYKCLVFDHDDTVVNSTATIHYPSFQLFLNEFRPGVECTLEQYFIKNFNPGFIQMCHEDFGLSDADLQDEVKFWLDYVKDHVPTAYSGIREIMERQRAQGGLICVVSHSYNDNIYRDFAANSLPRPDAVYGWELPPEQRKPNPYPLLEIMRIYDLKPSDILVIDDLKPGYDMSVACGVDFAGAGWANDIEPIERFMRANCSMYFKTIGELDNFLS